MYGLTMEEAQEVRELAYCDEDRRAMFSDQELHEARVKLSELYRAADFRAQMRAAAERKLEAVEYHLENTAYVEAGQHLAFGIGRTCQFRRLS